MKIRSRALTSSLLTTVLLAACSTDSNLSPVEPADPSFASSQGTAAQEAEFVPNELIVRFRRGASKTSRAAAMRAANAQEKERIVTGTMRRNGDDEGITVLRIPGNVPDAVLAMRGLDDVEYAEPNWIYKTDAVSNDPYVMNSSLWGMNSATGGFGSGAVTAWANGRTDCGSVYVGIIDEGYMYAHKDLADNAGTNPGETAGNNVDDDGNGYVDDVYGWDFAGNNASVFDGVDDDHGTHVAGTIGGVGGNGVGVAGVCWSVKMLSAKFLGRNGGTTANAVKAVDYFTGLKAKGINIVATNNSWGGGGFSQALKDAIERANGANILFIAAAGNSSYNCETTSCYPGGYSNANIITVASITSGGAMSSFSNYGSTTVDIGAPGSGILSTVPTSSRGGKQIVSGYATYSGTSMATPHVTGAAALYAAYHSGASAAAIRSAILSAATPTVSLNGKVATGGRLNVSGF